MNVLQNNARLQSLVDSLCDDVEKHLKRIAELEAAMKEAMQRIADHQVAAIRLVDQRNELEAERDKWHSDAVTQMKHKIRLEDEVERLKHPFHGIASGQQGEAD